MGKPTCSGKFQGRIKVHNLIFHGNFVKEFGELDNRGLDFRILGRLHHGMFNSGRIIGACLLEGTDPIFNSTAQSILQDCFDLLVKV